MWDLKVHILFQLIISTASITSVIREGGGQRPRMTKCDKGRTGCRKYQFCKWHTFKWPLSRWSFPARSNMPIKVKKYQKSSQGAKLFNDIDPFAVVKITASGRCERTGK